MFAAALLDAFPEHEAGTIAAAQSLAPVECALLAHRDLVLAGSRFTVRETAHQHGDHHHHAHWGGIRAAIEACALPQAVRSHAVGIFALLAEAEARVHGVPVEEVGFHEVGAADSIADILAAAWLIEALTGATWSVAPLPLGGGLAKTAHGMMPVPAPATALLLQGFAMHDDGVPGERVTPTGAAILRYLKPVPRAGGRLTCSGTGFGMRTLAGLSNCLRVLAFDTAAPATSPVHREVLVVSFEVDDQSGEDLAAGLAHLRAMHDVHDVLLMQAFGKKNRLAAHVQVLASPEATEAVIEACFAQTTTIGLRTQIVAGRALPRVVKEADVDGTPVRVKIVQRPEGFTGKAESDDISMGSTHAARVALRRRAEEACL
jgi:uncharacterized protein (TIGR00299 family) protein